MVYLILKMGSGGVVERYLTYPICVICYCANCHVFFLADETRQRDWDGIVTCHYASSHVRTWNFQNKCIGKHILKSKNESKDSVAQVCFCLKKLLNYDWKYGRNITVQIIMYDRWNKNQNWCFVNEWKIFWHLYSSRCSSHWLVCILSLLVFSQLHLLSTF